MSIIIAIIILGVLVIIHEFGHFYMAKKMGADVERFSVGMGPVIYSFYYKGTEFAISLIPLGGYVKIKGMETDKEIYTDGDFFNLSVWRRLLIVLAGPINNLILAFVIFTSVFLFFGENKIPSVTVESLPDYFERGDSIIVVDGTKIKYMDDIYNFYKKSEMHEFVIVRNAERMTIELPDSLLKNIYPIIDPIIGDMEKDGPAYNAGLQRGDRILAVNGDTIQTWNDMVDIIHNSAEKKISLKIKREDRVFDVVVIPQKRKIMDSDSVKEVGMIGIGIYTISQRDNPINALKRGWQNTLYSAGMIFYFIKTLFNGSVSMDNVGGPVAIVQATGQTMKWGIVSLLNFVALLSVNLFVINILPFPPADGGYVVMFGIEKIIGKQKSLIALKYFQMVGMALIFVLFIAITFNDIIRIIWG